MGMICKSLSFKKLSLIVRLGQAIKKEKHGKFSRKLYSTDDSGHHSDEVLVCADGYCDGGVLELSVFVIYH